MKEDFALDSFWLGNNPFYEIQAHLDVKSQIISLSSWSPFIINESTSGF